MYDQVMLWGQNVVKNFLQIFRSADDTFYRGSGDYIRVCEVGIAFSHTAGHIAVCRRDGDLAPLGTARSGIDARSTTRFIDHPNPGRQEDIADGIQPEFRSYSRSCAGECLSNSGAEGAKR